LAVAAFSWAIRSHKSYISGACSRRAMACSTEIWMVGPRGAGMASVTAGCSPVCSMPVCSIMAASGGMPSVPAGAAGEAGAGQGSGRSAVRPWSR